MLKSLSEEHHIEFIVTDIGNAVLLHKGELARDYSWVQLDAEKNSLQLITADGDTQDLGMKIHKPFEDRLKHTNELLMVELDENKTCRAVRFLKFTKIMN